MMKLRYLAFYCLASVGLLACAQTKYPVKKIFATYHEVLPGNIAVDASGNEVDSRDTVNYVYVETQSNNIKWTNAWKDNKSYSVIATLVEGDALDVGTNKATGRDIIVTATPGNKLWSLRLLPSEVNLPSPKKIACCQILLRGSYKSKEIFETVSDIVEVARAPSQ